jgi:hypothetical protein
LFPGLTPVTRRLKWRLLPVGGHKTFNCAAETRKENSRFLANLVPKRLVVLNVSFRSI